MIAHAQTITITLTFKLSYIAAKVVAHRFNTVTDLAANCFFQERAIAAGAFSLRKIS